MDLFGWKFDKWKHNFMSTGFALQTTGFMMTKHVKSSLMMYLCSPAR